MYDGHDNKLFEHFLVDAKRLILYTSRDYVDILEFLVKRWNVKKIERLLKH